MEAVAGLQVVVVSCMVAVEMKVHHMEAAVEMKVRRHKEVVAGSKVHHREVVVDLEIDHTSALEYHMIEMEGCFEQHMGVLGVVGCTKRGLYRSVDTMLEEQIQYIRLAGYCARNIQSFLPAIQSQLPIFEQC